MFSREKLTSGYFNPLLPVSMMVGKFFSDVDFLLKSTSDETKEN